LKTISTCVLVTALTACAASNPERTSVPAPYKPPAKTTPESTKPAEPAAAQKPAEGGTTAPAAGTTNAASTGKPADTISQPTPDADPIVLRVGGEPVFVSELLKQWLYSDNFRALDQVEDLIVSRIVYMEAQRLRVRIDRDEDLRMYDEAVKGIEAEIQKKSPGVSLDRYVERVMGLSASRYRDRLRQDTVRILLARRVTRAWLLQQEHVATHGIITDNEEDMKAVQKDLADGKTFEEVARARSVDKDSKNEGGRLTPIVDRNVPLGKLAFETEVGAIGGPIMVAGKWLILRVDSRTQPIEGDWAKIGAAVEESLKQRPVDEHEVQQWRRAMLDRYEVDTRPFYDLVDEPR
jgi:hypothetical protein